MGDVAMWTMDKRGQSVEQRKRDTLLTMKGENDKASNDGLFRTHECSALSNERLSGFVIKVTAIGSLGGCLFGYDMGSISSALPQIQNSFELSDSQAEWVVSILYLGGGFGAMIGGTLCDVFGRKRTILGTDLIFMLGALGLFLSNSYEQILVGRFVVGVGVAISGIADVSYLHEIAPIAFRGAIVSVNEACISLGFLFAFVAGFVYDDGDSEEWRIIFGWAGVLALVQFVGMMKMPESPIWLASKGRIQESQSAWEQINPGITTTAVDDSDADIHSPRHELCDTGGEEEIIDYEKYEKDSTNPLDRVPFWSWNQNILPRIQSTLSLLSRYRRQLYITLFLSTTQQFCGQANVLNYAPYIFAQAAGEDDPPGWSTLAIGFVKFFVTVIVIWKIEKVGRRTLLLFGMTFISVGLLALIVAFGGTNNDPDSWGNRKGFQLALPGVLLVVCGYSMSFGPLQWLLTSELFPTSIRGRALGASTIVTYLCASFVTRTFLSAQSVLGPAKVFAIYCIVNSIGIVFAYLAVPDTGEKTVEEIEVSLHQMWWWRYDSISLFQTEESDGLSFGNSNDQQEPISPRQSSGYSTTPDDDSRPSLDLT